MPTQRAWEAAAIVCREVAEIPDRTSPEDNADHMLVTGDELQPIIAAALDDFCAAYRQALDAAGWQIVPREPTETMQGAGAYQRENRKCVADIWRAMLAAAPEPPT